MFRGRRHQYPPEQEAARQARRRLLYVPKHTPSVPFKPKPKPEPRCRVPSADYFLMGHTSAARGRTLAESLERLQRSSNLPDEATQLLEAGWWDYHAARLRQLQHEPRRRRCR